MTQWTDFSQGGLHETDHSLDVALSGPGFLVVQTPAGPRYTRAGALSVNQQGTLVSAGGFPVLGQGGLITVRSSKVTFGTQGEVQDHGRTVDTLHIVDFPKPYALVKESRGLFAPTDPEVQPEAARDFQVVGGTLEESNVNAVRTMVDMIDMLRKYEATHRAIQAHDEAAPPSATGRDAWSHPTASRSSRTGTPPADATTITVGRQGQVGKPCLPRGISGQGRLA
jgi:flagellar basal-body rod protein FlgF